MKNKGFTLIELLGVIVILALLVVLVFPSIINSVRDSSKKTDRLTLELIYNAADLYIDNNMNKFPKMNGSKYVITLQNLVDEGLLVSPIKLSENDDDLTNRKCVQVSYNDGFQYELKDTGACKTIYSNGQIIYFDVATGKSCSESEYKLDNSNTGYNGFNGTNVQNSCLKFYAFNDDGGDKLNLLLDHNTTTSVAWTNSETDTNVNGPIDLIEKLYNDTKNWEGTEKLSEYTMDQRTQLSQAYYTIEYNKTPAYEGATTPYKARLITAQEIAKITGADREDTLNWKEESSSNRYFFDSLSSIQSDTCKEGNTTGCKYGWLYDRTSIDCTIYGCLNNSDVSINGYWTVSSYPNHFSYATHVDSTGTILNVEGLTVNHSISGVRPVIEILKDKLK